MYRVLIAILISLIKKKLKQMTTTNLKGRKILFASIPADGHFSPLTGLAKHLQAAGCDVRWYTSERYETKLAKLQIPLYPFAKALDIPGDKIDEVFPERKKIKSTIKKLNFDLENYFIKRGTEFYEDIKDINETFCFDLIIADCVFTGIPFVKELLHKPVIGVGVLPLTETSKDLAPSGLGITPAKSAAGKMKQSLLRFAAKNILFRKPNQLFHATLEQYGIAHENIFLFDAMIKKSSMLLQSGTPGFEYKRSDMSSNIRFIGSLLPHTTAASGAQWFDERLNKYSHIVLVTQGTVEKDVNKIIIPTIEAFKNTETLVIATTGGSQTSMLKAKYHQQNVIVEDFIPFNDVMPYCDVYVTNGGYGGVMLGIENKLPMVVAGVHEGKNEICARVGYFKLGINLKTETPNAQQIYKAAIEVMNNNIYKENIEKLGDEFAAYDPNALCEKYVLELLQQKNFTKSISNKPAEKIY